MKFLDRHSDQPFHISVVTLGEYAEGFEDVSDPLFAPSLQPFHVIEISRAIALRYARLSRVMRRAGNRIGDNDLWIAATVIEAGLPLITRNPSDFARVEGIQVIEY